jgi:hypothetical protein
MSFGETSFSPRVRGVESFKRGRGMGIVFSGWAYTEAEAIVGVEGVSAGEGFLGGISLDVTQGEEGDGKVFSSPAFEE